MDAPVEELGAPAEPLGPSGAPDLRTATHPGQSQAQALAADRARGADRFGCFFPQLALGPALAIGGRRTRQQRRLGMRRELPLSFPTLSYAL